MELWKKLWCYGKKTLDTIPKTMELLLTMEKIMVH